MKIRNLVSSSVVAAASCALAHAQDSVSKASCLPGDAVSPYQDGAAALGSEQENHYVVDAQDLIGSWGSQFLIAPIVKAGRTNSLYFTNLMNAQGISRRSLKNRPFVKASYPLWTAQPGVGVNNDPTKNDAPGAFIDASQKRGVQFAATFTEIDTTDFAADYQGVVTAIVNADPEDPRRLFVTRIQTAVNAPDETTEHATTYVGAVDAHGNTAFRSDGFGMTMPASGLAAILGNNYFLVDALGRNPGVRNVVTDDFLGVSQFDLGATSWLVRGSSTSYNCPTIAPQEVFGVAGILGSNFSKEFVRGSSFPTTSDLSHLPISAIDHRGNLSYLSRNFPPLSSTFGLAALIGHNSSGIADQMIVFGLDASANVTGKLGLVLPATVTDNDDGFVNLGTGTNQFDHYHSQVAFQGGNGQVAMNLDSAGNLLLAAQVAMPAFVSATNPENYIAVAKVDSSGGIAWTMAGYCVGNTPAVGFGKAIKDGPGGNVIGQMVPASKSTTTLGPSVSAPMIDGAGNVWFVSFVEMFDGTSTQVALLRSVYQPTTFSYELELVARVGSASQFLGVNSGVNYILSDLRIADSNSVHSGTAWSNNIQEQGFMGIDGACFDPVDPRSLGGLIVSAQITYDTSGDGIFQTCSSTDPVPSFDESYRVLLYVGANGTTGVDNYGVGCAGSGGVAPTLTFDGYPAVGKPITLSVTNGIGGQSALFFFGLVQASTNLPGPCSLLVAPILPLNLTLPLFGAPVPGGGSISVPTVIPTVPSGFTVTMQALCTDPGVTWGFSATQGVQITFQ